MCKAAAPAGQELLRRTCAACTAAAMQLRCHIRAADELTATPDPLPYTNACGVRVPQRVELIHHALWWPVATLNP
jgi:hypothetical protein